MKKSIMLIICIFTFYLNALAQNKLDYGIKLSAYQAEAKLYEFIDPFPFYNKDLYNNHSLIYGTNTPTLNFSGGVFVNYNLVKSGRIKLNTELNLNTKNYKQEDNNFNEFKITCTYLDVPLNIKLQPFYKAGAFIETGIYQAFILSNKTQFPATNTNSSEFEKRRSRANTREVNLFGFNVGVGYEFKKFDVEASFRTDKQYAYVGLGVRASLKRFFTK